jgi:hypothetical protein
MTRDLAMYAFLNRVRSLFNIGHHLLPEVPRQSSQILHQQR